MPNAVIYYCIAEKYSNVQKKDRLVWEGAGKLLFYSSRSSAWFVVWLEHIIHLFKAVNQTSGQFFAAAEFFDQVQAEGARFAFAVDVSHRTHQRTKNHFGVIFEEIDLKKSLKKTWISLGIFGVKWFYL